MLFKRKSRTLETPESSPSVRTRSRGAARGEEDTAAADVDEILASRRNPQRATRGTTRLGASAGSGSTSSMKAAAAPVSSQHDGEVVPQSDSGSDSEDDMSIDKIAARHGLMTTPAAKASSVKRRVISSADEDEGIVTPTPKRRKLPRKAFESDVDDAPVLPREDESSSVVSTPKLRTVGSNSNKSTARKHSHRRISDSDDSPSEEEMGELPTTTLNSRGHGRPAKRRRTSNVEDSPAETERAMSPNSDASREPDESSNDLRAGDEVSNADSADINDLEYSPPPTPTKPTPKERKKESLDRLRNARQNKSSPIAARRVKKEEADNEESEPLAWKSSGTGTSSDGEESESGSDSSSESESFIDDEDDTPENDEAVQEALAPALRRLPDHFPVFVEFLVRLYLKPKLFDKLSKEENYKAAIAAVRRHADSAALKSLNSTWSAPFKRTLQDRPNLVGPYDCKPGEWHGDCQACWTRGTYACTATRSYEMWTRQGFYHRETFEDKPERNVKYAKETTRDFENSAQVETFHYPSGFRFIVGELCAQRAQKYHRARHSLYCMFDRVKAEVDSARDKDPDLVRTRNIGHLMQELKVFVLELRRDFESDCGKLMLDDE